MKDVMIDLETFGTGPNAVIVQIGAVYFDKDTGELGREFKVNIDPRSHVHIGGVMDAETVQWWLGQSDAARQSILQKGQDIVVVANELNRFLADAARVWSHATFDFPLIQNLFRLCHIQPAFSYRTARDIRTLVWLAGARATKSNRAGVHHDALDDAKYQVKYTVEALKIVKANKKLIQLLNAELDVEEK